MAVVYRHRNPITLEVFYIGMGREDRPYEGSRSREWINYVKKCGGYLIEVVAEDLSKEQAKELEEFLIEEYGRQINNSGKLVNIDIGDKRAKATIEKIGRYERTEEHREKIRQRLKGEKSYMFGKKRSWKQKKRLSEAAQGNTNVKGRIYITDGTKNRMIEPEGEIPDGWRVGRTTPWQSK